MIKVVNKLPGKTIGMALFPYILILKGHEGNRELINHEKIHLRQQLEMLIIPFYVQYLLEYMLRFCWVPFFTYRRISFEREAFANQANLNYLKERKFWGFWKYI